ncbi:MAG: PRC-barrel domain-containing protein [Streptosporangiaceae bacterium]
MDERPDPHGREARATVVEDGRAWHVTGPFEVDAYSPGRRLAASHGFLVDDEADRPVGVVDDVLVNEDDGSAIALVVVCGWSGRRRLAVPVDDVVTILPGKRRLVVRDGRRGEHLERGGLAARMRALAARLALRSRS